MASAAKRLATVETVRHADASAARVAPATHPISVHLTPFAPMAEKWPINDRRRWATFYGRTVSQVVRATLSKVRLAPADAKASQEADDNVDLLGPVPPELVRLVSVEAGELVPYAIFWDGVTLGQLQDALADLVATGWRPASLEGAA